METAFPYNAPPSNLSPSEYNDHVSDFGATNIKSQSFQNPQTYLHMTNNLSIEIIPATYYGDFSTI